MKYYTKLMKYTTYCVTDVDTFISITGKEGIEL